MKPSNFILNSDYLSIARAEFDTYTVSFSSGTIAAGAFISLNKNVSASATAGAIDRVAISKDNGDYTLGNYKTITAVWDSSNKVVGTIHVNRASTTTLKVELELQNLRSDAQSTYPAMSFTIKLSRFLPPNVF